MFSQDQASRSSTQETRRPWQPVIREWLAAATQRMLDLARIQPGDQVLDVTEPDSDLWVQAARRAGPFGKVTAIHRSGNMLAQTAQAAQEAEIANLENLVMEAEKLGFADRSFDALLCQFGALSFYDLHGGLRQMHRVLKPWGRACVIALTQPERNAFISIPLAILRDRFPPEALPVQPDLFRLGARGALEAALSQAGFRQVETHILSAPLRLQSAAVCVDFEREAFTVLRTLTTLMEEAVREEAWREIEAAFRQFEQADGFEAPCEVTVGLGTRCG